ncbi:MAG: tetratricopeptide repeat protein [Polyangiaceae bacterium]
MSVVDIHPEELLDKSAASALSPSEAQLLKAHLERCEVCRFELSLRADLEEDVASRRISVPPQLLSQMPPQAAEAPIAPRRLRRWSVAWVAAAAMFVVAAGAFASYAAPGVWPWVQRLEIRVSQSSLQAVDDGVVSAKPHVRTAPLAAKSAGPGVDAPSAVASLAPAPLALVPAASASCPLPAPAPAHVAHARRTSAARSASPANEPVAANVASSATSEEETPQAMFSNANRARRAGDVTRAAELYRTLQQRYPRSSEASLSRVTLATLLLGSDPSASLASFDAYLASGSQPLTAEALVGRARALRALGRGAEARRAWQDVQSRYPTSVYAAAARDALGGSSTP